MPVYNGQAFLGEAIESIINQSHENFELIVIDDNSSDSSNEIIKSYDDKRIRVLRNKKNLGTGASLNRGLAVAKGEYIARLDADDIALWDRLERQVSFLLQHSNIVVVGGSAIVIDEFGNEISKLITRARDSLTIKWALLFGSPFVHSSMMFRKEAVLGHMGGYKKQTFMEDFDLWSRMIFQYEMCNLPDFLVEYRIHKDQKTTKKAISKKYYRERTKIISNFCAKLFPTQVISQKDIEALASYREFRKFPYRENGIQSFSKLVKMLKQSYQKDNKSWLESKGYRDFSCREFMILSRIAMMNGKVGTFLELIWQSVLYSPVTFAKVLLEELSFKK